MKVAMFLFRFVRFIMQLETASLNFQNPIRNNSADPSMVFADGEYHMTYTSGDHIEITRAPTIGGLGDGDTRVIWADSDPTRNRDMWAPEIHLIDNVWHMFYSSRNADESGSYKTRVLVGCDGPNPSDCNYRFGATLVPPEGKMGGRDGKDSYSIDGSYMEIAGKGRYHLLSIHDQNGVQSVAIAEVNTTTWEVPAWNVISRPQYSWEKFDGQGAGAQVMAVGTGLNEAPYPLYHNDDVWISYSASSCDTPQYALGLLHWNGGDPLQESSWNKTGPVLSAANGNYGTGHNSFFKSPDGTEIWNLFHATSNPQGSCSSNRYAMAQRVSFDDQDLPDFGKPQALTDAIAPPSGEKWQG